MGWEGGNDDRTASFLSEDRLGTGEAEVKDWYAWRLNCTQITCTWTDDFSLLPVKCLCLIMVLVFV